MATYGPEQVPSTGLDPTYNPAGAGGDRVPPGALLHIKNGNAGALTLTIATPLVLDGDLAVGDRVIAPAIPATIGTRFVRIPTNEVYRDPADGLVGLTWSVQANVTFAVLT